MSETSNEVLDPRTLSGGPSDGGFYLTKSEAQVDAEEREAELKGDRRDSESGTGFEATRNVAVEDNDTSAYVGVSSEYMTYAGVQNQPFAAEEGAEKAREDRILGRAAGAVGSDPEHKGQQTQGGGSNLPTVYSHTSGDNVTPEEVDRAKVHGESRKKEKAAAEKPAQRPPVKQAAASGKTEE